MPTAKIGTRKKADSGSTARWNSPNGTVQAIRIAANSLPARTDSARAKPAAHPPTKQTREIDRDNRAQPENASARRAPAPRRAKAKIKALIAVGIRS